MKLILLILMLSLNASAQFVPEWAKKVVWYQIFPERFYNGDTTNDPVKESLKGSYPHDHSSGWEVHPWTSDWYELQPYEKENGKDIWFNIQRRRYGGDLQGIIDKLDYLQELGVTALYLNPVFYAPSSHKYDAAMYHHIDPYFGPDPEGDLEIMKNEIPHDPASWQWTSADLLALKLINEVHKRDMFIIFDGVFNHMGINSFAFKDVIKNQNNSFYKDWFAITSWDDEDKGTTFSYNGWYGVTELPEFLEDENGIVEGPKKYIFDITRRWMDPNGDGDPSDGIDGWRLDVAFCVQHQFWKEWRKLVKSINSNAYLTAEVIDPLNVLKKYLQGDEFDAVMNYNFAFACAEFFIEEETKITVEAFDAKLRELRNAFPGGVEFVQQNLFGSHDANRIGSHIVNRNIGGYRNWGEYFGLSKGSNPLYNTRKPNEEELKIQKLFALFQMTYVGAPMIYYGDEAGMWGANDPDCRKPMIWDQFIYDDEKVLPDQSLKKQADKVKFNRELFEYYKSLIKIRNENITLQLGDFETLITGNDNELYIFERNYDNDKIIVAVNNSHKEIIVELKVEHKEYFSDLLSREAVSAEGGIMKFKVNPKSGRILKKDFYK
jgi:cyclomaltodextrinase / maltogenic alpha-amylase / neopullulanase